MMLMKMIFFVCNLRCFRDLGENVKNHYFLSHLEFYMILRNVLARDGDVSSCLDLTSWKLCYFPADFTIERIHSKEVDPDPQI